MTLGSLILGAKKGFAITSILFIGGNYGYAAGNFVGEAIDPTEVSQPNTLFEVFAEKDEDYENFGKYQAYINKEGAVVNYEETRIDKGNQAIDAAQDYAGLIDDATECKDEAEKNAKKAQDELYINNKKAQEKADEEAESEIKKHEEAYKEELKQRDEEMKKQEEAYKEELKQRDEEMKKQEEEARERMEKEAADRQKAAEEYKEKAEQEAKDRQKESEKQNEQEQDDGMSM